MSEALATYGPLGVLTLAVYLLARVIERLVLSRWARDPAPMIAEPASLITNKDLRDEIHKRANQTQELISQIAVKVALVERDVQWMKRAMHLSNGKERSE